MKYLLDTHSLIWFLGGDPQFSAHARQLIEDDESELFVSVASLWEMAIKFSIGKLTLEKPFEQMFPEQLERNGIDILGIGVAHLKLLCALPFHHRDPFDRLIIAQALAEAMPIIGMDSVFGEYGVAMEW